MADSYEDSKKIMSVASRVLFQELSQHLISILKIFWIVTGQVEVRELGVRVSWKGFWNTKVRISFRILTAS